MQAVNKRAYAVVRGGNRPELVFPSIHKTKEEVYAWVKANVPGAQEVSENQWIDHKSKAMASLGVRLVTVEFIVRPWPPAIWRKGKKYMFEEL
jgi:hypothetical protein